MKLKRIRVVYQIVNKINHKVYVGSTNDISSRWSQHKSMLKKGSHHSLYLQRAFRKYGEDAFKLEVLEDCSDCTREELRKREARWIDYTGSYEDGYNLTNNTNSSFDDPAVQKKVHETLKREGKGLYNPEVQKEIHETLKREGKGYGYDPELNKKGREACKREGKGSYYNAESRKKAHKKAMEAQKRDRIRRGHEIVQYLFTHGLGINEENFNQFRLVVHPYTNTRHIPTYEWFSRNRTKLITKNIK